MAQMTPKQARTITSTDELIDMQINSSFLHSSDN